MQPRRHDRIHARDRGLDLRRRAKAGLVLVQARVDRHERGLAVAKEPVDRLVGFAVHGAAAVLLLRVDPNDADDGHLLAP